MEQLRQEQDTDPVINTTRWPITHGENIVSGRFKRVQSQLWIVNNLLTKSGRHVVPRKTLLNQKYVVQLILARRKHICS